MTVRIPYSEMEGTPPLFRDYVDSFDRVAPLFAGPVSTPDAHRDEAARLTGRAWPRDAVAERLVERNRALGADDEALRSLAALAQEGTYAVVAGQQAGPYTGPMYALYKAITAIRLSNTLNREGSCRFIPLFWCASEDHDLDEINHVHVPEADGPRRIATGLTASGAPASAVPVDDQILRFHDEVFARLPASEYRDDLARRLAPRQGESLSTWFARCLLRLLRGTGIAVVEPETIRDLATPILTAAVARANEINDALASTRSRLTGLGYSPILDEGAQLHLFRIEDGTRSRIRGATRGLVSEIEREPTAFSTDVVLRPVLQSYVLPVITLVGGPSEVAYLAELGGVFRCLDVPMPLVFPRASATLVTARQTRALERFGLAPDQILALASDDPPGGGRDDPSFEVPLLHMESSFAEAFEEIRSGLEGIDPQGVKAAEKIARQIEERLARLRSKVREAGERAAGVGRDRWRRLRAEILPKGRLQERVYGPLPFLTRHGPDLPERLLSMLDVLDFRHQVLDPGGSPGPIPQEGNR